MAIIFMDGPDHYGTGGSGSANQQLLLNGVYAQVAALNLLANGGPGGVGTVFEHGTNNASELRKVLPGQRDVVGWGMRFYFPQLPGGAQLLYQFMDLNAAALCGLYITSTGALLFQTNTGTVIWLSDPVIVAQSWQHIECVVGFSVNTADGFLRVGVDSVTLVSIDNINTSVTNDKCAQVYQSMFGGVRTRDYYLWDDTGDLNNSGMQGDRQVVTSYPTADTAVNDWVPSVGGAGWPLVDNVPPDDSVYIYANASPLASAFEMGDIDTDITNISAVMLVGRVWKSDAGLAAIQLNITSGADTAASADKPVSTNKVFYNQVFEVDPATDLKWTPGGVNTAQAGIERTL